jgi:hypothetical protein
MTFAGVAVRDAKIHSPKIMPPRKVVLGLSTAHYSINYGKIKSNGTQFEINILPREFRVCS